MNECVLCLKSTKFVTSFIPREINWHPIRGGTVVIVVLVVVVLVVVVVVVGPYPSSKLDQRETF